MTEYMKQNHSHDEPPSPFEGTPFSCTARYESYQSREPLERLVEQAEKIHSKLESDGEIQTDEAVVRAMEGTNRESFYYGHVGPVAETADTLRWNLAWHFDPDAYPEDDTERMDALSDLNIPDTSTYSSVPNAVQECQQALKEMHERNGRGMTLNEMGIANIPGPNVTFGPNSGFAGKLRAYLKRVPWVEPPDNTAPAWEWVGDESTSNAEATTEEGGANA